MSRPSFEELVSHSRSNHLDMYQDLWEKPVELALLLFEHAFAEQQAEELGTIIELSRKSKYEWDTASRIAQSALNAEQQIPQNLADWTADVLAGARKRPGTGSRTPARDMIFCATVEDLRNQIGTTPTKSSATEAWSACDVVAEASGNSYKTIERAWGLRNT